MQPLMSTLATPIDWARVELWSQDLAQDRLEGIRAAFLAGKVGGLEVMRSPAPSDLQATANRFLLEYWLAERRGALPPVSAVDPVRLAPALGRILLVEPVEHGADFRYRLFGTDVAAVSGFEMTGRLLSDHPLPLELVSFGLALYRNLMERPEPVKTVNLPPTTLYSSWERIVLPFAGANGEVARFLVGNTGFDQDGRELHG
jgi:hypothetical protein